MSFKASPLHGCWLNLNIPWLLHNKERNKKRIHVSPPNESYLNLVFFFSLPADKRQGFMEFILNIYFIVNNLL